MTIRDRITQEEIEVIKKELLDKIKLYNNDNIKIATKLYYAEGVQAINKIYCINDDSMLRIYNKSYEALKNHCISSIQLNYEFRGIVYNDTITSDSIESYFLSKNVEAYTETHDIKNISDDILSFATIAYDYYENEAPNISIIFDTLLVIQMFANDKTYFINQELLKTEILTDNEK